MVSDDFGNWYYEYTDMSKITLRNNTFSENGNHFQGVLNIYKMPNVEISEDNIFIANTD